ncbi:hypothetical protein AB0B45_26355 [Nonomuraea sp. NPDC049152]|uniref:hypothetical protein n=1 Tax=Nonomuraea sp. NPDC049152 TaxID=3154350 RepID=UPI00340746E6
MASAPARRVLEALMSTSAWLGEATLLLTLLDARGIAVSDEIRARITSCSDPVQFDVWTRRAAVASSADEVFE